jgi:subtilase family serine protease
METKPFYKMPGLNYFNRKPSPPITVEPQLTAKCFIQPTISTGNPDFPPQYFNGSQIVSLYNIPSIKPVAANTYKTTIAIVVAYTYPNLLNDLNIYWTNNINYGPDSIPPTVNIHTMPGATQNVGWGQEECLDVQLVCTVNPNANIWVVEAKTAKISDMIDAVNYATQVIKADVVSMSWGNSDSIYNNVYNRYFNNPSVTYCAATGDNNSVSWPAVQSNCLAVGGTSLIWTPNSSTVQRTEYTWNGAGCGYSRTILQPLYQKLVSSIAHIYRAVPDISLIANPQTSVYTVYDGSWFSVGGTSVATPIMAGIISIANQQRFNQNKSALTSVFPSANNIQNYLYNSILVSPTKYKNDFNDVVIGSGVGSTPASGLTTYSSNIGFDITTGLGSPNATNLCNDLAESI